MKKLLILVLTVMMSVSIFACAKTPSETAIYTAGTYEATEFGMNGDVVVTAEFSESKILSVTATGELETKGLGDKALEELSKVVVEKQSADVDVVSGATVSSTAMLKAMQNCIDQAKGIATNDDTTTVGDMSADVVVVGGGAAGLSAAIEAAAAGSKVILIEKQGNLGGSTNFSAGAIVRNATEEEAKNSGALAGDDLVDYYMEVAEGNADRDYIEYIISKSNENFEWLKNLGFQSNYMDYEGCFGEILAVEWGVGGTQMISVLNQKAVELGVEIVLNTAATELLLNDEIVNGVRAVSNGAEITIEAKSVVLATGSYIYDSELVNDHTALGNVLTLMGGPGNTGDGLKMAEAVNAKKTFKGPGLLSSWSTVSQTISYVPSAYFVAVDGNAQRFINEVEFYSIFANEAIKQNIAMFWIVYDSNTVSHDMLNIVEEGCMLQADTLEELAALMGVDANALVSTITDYNALCEGKEDTQFGKPEKYLEKVETGPYYALMSLPVAIGTFGGLSIDENSQVLDINNTPIANLFAAGEVANADFFGEVYPISGSCLTYATVTGRIAGKAAAANVK